MENNNKYEYLLKDITKLKGIGKKTSQLLKKKKINNIFDFLWRLPVSFVDRSQNVNIKELKIGKISTLTVTVKKYSFPRIRNLPNRVICEDNTGSLDCIFFSKWEEFGNVCSSVVIHQLNRTVFQILLRAILE